MNLHDSVVFSEVSCTRRRRVTNAGAAFAFVFSALIGCASAAGIPDATRSPPPLTVVSARVAAHASLRVVAFGSSSTQGVGASNADATYPAQLQARLMGAVPQSSVTVINQGIGGQDAEEFHTRLAAVLTAKPDLVIFQTGTNDLLRNLPLERFRALTREDVQTLRDAHVDVVLMEPQFCPKFAEKAGAFGYVETVRQIGAELGIPVVRRWDLMRTWLADHVARPEELQSADGLHMADRGYSLLARAVMREILKDAGIDPMPKTRILSASR